MVRKNYWEVDSQNARVQLSVYADLAALNTARPTGLTGEIAWVEDSDSMYKWDSDLSAWTNASGNILASTAITVITNGQTAFTITSGLEIVKLRINASDYYETESFTVTWANMLWINTDANGGFDLKTTDKVTLFYNA